MSHLPGMPIVRSIATCVGLVCAVAGDARAQLKTVVHASGFHSPVAMVQDPTDRTVQFVVEQRGHIRVVRSGTVLAADFLDLSMSISTTSGEQGLLGLAFAPDYATSGRFFVNFTNPAGHTVIARFKRSADPVRADAASRFDLKWGGPTGPGFITQPYSNHNGGTIVFGPDGYLYIGMGDGGAGDDPENRAQNPTELLGKMLRIDVSVADADLQGYKVPPDNPFAGGSGPIGTRPEIWSFGLRNPWKFSFDAPAARGGTGALVIADVGQGRYEEIDYEPANKGGRNYGWRVREGRHDEVTSPGPAYLPLVDPIYEYDHSTGLSITGGFVYRGHLLSPARRGRYFFADFSARRVFSIGLTVDPGTREATASQPVEHTAELGGASTIGNISAFGTDADSELYLVSYVSGIIFKVVETQPRSQGPGDFDGDARADIAVFHPDTGAWSVELSSSNYASSFSKPWGVATDVPVPGDYDGDGKSDLAVYRPSSGVWWVLQSNSNYTGFTSTPWGVSTDVPVPGDYDGDGKTDFAVYRPSAGTWFALLSSGNYTTYLSIHWGVSADTPVPGDYDGDGKTDFAVYRPSSGTWFVLLSSGNYTTYLGIHWGVGADTPVPGDFDGDGKADLAVYRPSTGTWFVLQSTSGYTAYASYAWGAGADTALPLPHP